MGWGVPVTWQGWACFGLWLAVLIADLAWYAGQTPANGSNNLPLRTTTVFIGVLVVDVLALSLVCIKRGEPLR